MGMGQQIEWTRHATERAGQRAVRTSAVDAAVNWGTEFPQGCGRSAYYLDEAAVARARRAGEDVSRWIRTAVVLGLDGGVVTVIRTDDVSRLKRYRQRSFGGRGRRDRWVN